MSQYANLPDGRVVELARHNLDGEPCWFLVCPGCKIVGEIDDDQFHGRVSIQCPECPFHETIDLAALLGEA